jgi:hypothetical protein
MRKKLCKAVVILLVGGGLTFVCVVAAPPETTAAGYELSHVVRFEAGATRLRGGDSITVDEIDGTSDKLASGNTYVIKGTYKLASRKHARLLASVTANQPRARY